MKKIISQVVQLFQQKLETGFAKPALDL